MYPFATSAQVMNYYVMQILREWHYPNQEDTARLMDVITKRFGSLPSTDAVDVYRTSNSLITLNVSRGVPAIYLRMRSAWLQAREGGGSVATSKAAAAGLMTLRSCHSQVRPSLE
jgi:hypothetical protein